MRKFGVRIVTKIKNTGRFYCPNCRSTQRYHQKKRREFLSVFSLPVLPLKELDSTVECLDCQQSFPSQVLLTSPEISKTNFLPTLIKMIILMIKAGHAKEECLATEKIEFIKKVYEKVAQVAIGELEIHKEIDLIFGNHSSATDYLKLVSPYLSNHAKEMLLKAAYIVAVADEVIEKKEKDLLDEMGIALEMTASHFQQTLAKIMAG